METLKEEDYSWREVKLHSLVPVVGEAEPPELESESGERRRGREVLIAVDHRPNSKHAFDWALIRRPADTLCLVHAISNESPALHSVENMTLKMVEGKNEVEEAKHLKQRNSRLRRCLD